MILPIITKINLFNTTRTSTCYQKKLGQVLRCDDVFGALTPRRIVVQFSFLGFDRPLLLPKKVYFLSDDSHI